jgi:hypothetical protein
MLFTDLFVVFFSSEGRSNGSERGPFEKKGDFVYDF